MRRLKPIYIVLMLFFVPFTMMAQLTAPNANTLRYSSYGSATSKDKIFVFCNTSGTTKGSLMARDTTLSELSDYRWYMWNGLTKSFDIEQKSDLSVPFSTIDGLEEGGYRVKISNSTDTMFFTCWVFIDKPFASAKLMNNGCDYVALDGTAAVDTFFYYDPFLGNPIKLPNAVRHLWSSTPSSSIPYPDLRIDPYTFDPPLDDVTYKLVVTDSMGCSNESSFYYESIHVKADLSSDVTEGEAPLGVNFTNESIRGYIYNWDFGDDTENSTLEIPETHMFYRPENYWVSLSIESVLHCTDIDSIKITVNPSSLAIPNAFTPNDDGYNDRFILEKSSLRYLNVQIFSNTGVKVYGFASSGENIQGWNGWDGNIDNSTRKASPGVYYYIIKAIGWDDKKYDGEEYRGFLYLYR